MPCGAWFRFLDRPSPSERVRSRSAAVPNGLELPAYSPRPVPSRRGDDRRRPRLFGWVEETNGPHAKSSEESRALDSVPRVAGWRMELLARLTPGHSRAHLVADDRIPMMSRAFVPSPQACHGFVIDVASARTSRGRGVHAWCSSGRARCSSNIMLDGIQRGVSRRTRPCALP